MEMKDLKWVMKIHMTGKKGALAQYHCKELDAYMTIHTPLMTDGWGRGEAVYYFGNELKELSKEEFLTRIQKRKQ